MPNAKIYFQNELDQKVPQRIIWASRFDLKNGETALVVFGSVTISGIHSYVVSTQDKIIYMNNSSGLPKNLVFSYADITDFELKVEGKFKFIYLKIKNGHTEKFDIKAPMEETEKLFNFLSDYREKGTSIANSEEKPIDPHQIRNAKSDELSSKRAIQHYKLNYCSGLDSRNQPGEVRITLNGYDQVMEINTSSAQVIKIPYPSIKSSIVKTEVEIPSYDKKNKYLFYVAVDCIIDGKVCNVVFSKKQRQDLVVDTIREFNYALNHLDAYSERINARNEKYDQKIKRLQDEREQLVSKKASNVDQMHDLLGRNSNVKFEMNEQTESDTLEQQSNSKFSPTAQSPFDEIKKFKELLDQGILTQEEFDAKKKQLLNI